MGKSGKDARKEVRAKASKGRDAARAGRNKARSAIRSAVALLACVLMAVAVGCASATPSSASNAQDIQGCSVVINLNIPAVQGTNGLASVADWAGDIPAGFAGPIVIQIHDVLGTQAVNNEGQTTQTATPTNQNGLTGDKPIEALADVAKPGLTAGASAVADSAGEAVTAAVGAASTP